jgi:hypothetical protein
MKKAGLLVSGACLLLLCVCAGSCTVAAQSMATSSTVTLYSAIKHRNEQLRSCVNFAETRARMNASGGSLCDLYYGNMYAGDDWDWFQSSPQRGHRSLVRDLGALAWTDRFTVPIVEPLPKLKPGEQRSISVDTSGADGADGAPGARGRDAADADGVVRPRESPEPSRVENRERPPKHDGKPKIDPVFAKAILGHLYVIHVVDDVSDFYALFRVEALARGDNCTISWKLIPAPEAQTSQRK